MADSTWLANNVVKYLNTHRQRVERREISASTLINYIKPIKLFCEQLEISLPWKSITRACQGAGDTPMTGCRLSMK